MFDDQPTDVRHFVTPKASIVGERDRLKPELCVAAGVRRVNVRPLAPLEAEKEKRYPRTRNSAGTG